MGRSSTQGSLIPVVSASGGRLRVLCSSQEVLLVGGRFGLAPDEVGQCIVPFPPTGKVCRGNGGVKSDVI